jgi:hypothetical protein
MTHYRRRATSHGEGIMTLVDLTQSTGTDQEWIG